MITAAGVLVAAGSVFATPVAPGQTYTQKTITVKVGKTTTTITTPAVTALAVPAGSVYEGSSVTPFSMAAANKSYLTGNIIAAVYEQPNGMYDFYYQVDNTSSSPLDHITSLTVSDFSGYTTNVNTASLTPSTLSGFTGNGFTANNNVLPYSVFRSSAYTQGQTLTFTYGQTTGTTLKPGTNSAIFMVQTNATSFNMLGGFSISGTGAAYAGTFQPTPEPGFYGTLAVAISAVILVLRRRSSKAQPTA